MRVDVRQTHAHTNTASSNLNVFDSCGAEGLNITFCQNILRIDSDWLTDRRSVNVTVENGNSYGQIWRG